MDGLTYFWQPAKAAPSDFTSLAHQTPWKAFEDASAAGWTWGDFVITQGDGSPVTADDVLRSAPLVRTPAG